VLKTFVFHLQTNGQTEKFNRTLINMLAIYTKTHQKDWNTYLSYMLHVYKTSVHTSIRETPYFLIYRRMQKCHIIGYFKDRKRKARYGQYKQKILANIEKVFQKVQYYGDIIKYKRENENRKRNYEHSFKYWRFCLAICI
jgi:hypothetical protein